MTFTARSIFSLKAAAGSLGLLLALLTLLITPVCLCAGDKASVHPIEIHNRVLWVYRGSMITLMDVVHQLDHQLQRMGGDESITPAERYEYYQQSWAPVLRDMIDNELIYQDAMDHGMPVTDGQAKDELVQIHGDQYLSRLDEINKSLPDAIEMVKKELLVQRMYYFRVLFPARQAVTPSRLTRAYEEYLEKNPATVFWRYQVLTLRASRQEAFEAAQKLIQEHDKGSSLDQLQALFPASKGSVSGQEDSSQKPLVQLAITSFEQVSEQISARYLEQLAALEAGKISQPIDFSRNEEEGIYRLILLQAKEKREPESFAVMRVRFEEQMIEQGEMAERAKYLTGLRKRLELEQGESFNQIFRPTTPLFILR